MGDALGDTVMLELEVGLTRDVERQSILHQQRQELALLAFDEPASDAMLQLPDVLQAAFPLLDETPDDVFGAVYSGMLLWFEVGDWHALILLADEHD